jgi:hypothetical protein
METALLLHLLGGKELYTCAVKGEITTEKAKSKMFTSLDVDKIPPGCLVGLEV